MIFWLKYILLKIFFPGGRLTLEYCLFVRLNKERRSVGLPTLFFQNDLQKVARKHSQDMARNDYFDHTNLANQSPSDRFKSSQVSEVISGENLAKVRGYKNPVKVAHIGLMNSPGHKANILQKAYNCVGIGLAIAKDKTFYFTQNFSYRKIFIVNPPTVFRFKKKVKLLFKIIDPSLEKVLIKICNRANEVTFEKHLSISGLNKVNFLVEVAANGKYFCKIYVPTGKSTQYRLINEFEFQKKGLLW
jgi:hypothetical protein